MTTPSETTFNQNYQKRLQHLKLKGLQPKTIDAYSRGIRRIGKHSGHQVNDLTEQQLLDYFHGLLDTHSWSAVKYTHLTSKTTNNAEQQINQLMNGFSITWRNIK